MVKDSSRKRHFCKYHAKQAAAVPQRIPINNRRLQAFLYVDSEHREKEENQNAFWHFKIFGTLVITFFFFLQSIKENKLTQYQRKKQAAQTTDCRGRLEKAQAFFSLFFMVFFFFFFLFLTYKMCPFALTWANSLQQQRNTSFTIHFKIKQGSFLCIVPQKSYLLVLNTFLITPKDDQNKTVSTEIIL